MAARRQDNPRAPRHPPVDDYLAALDDPIRTMATELRERIHRCIPDIEEGIAWRVPFFYRKGPICYISAAKSHVTFGLTHGADIQDPSGRLQGTGRSPIKKALLIPGDKVPWSHIDDWLHQSIAIDEMQRDDIP